MKLARVSPPTIDKNLVAGRSVDILGIVNVDPRESREGFTLLEVATLPSPEGVLLSVGLIPNNVHKNVGDEESAQGVLVPGVFGGVVVGEVESAVAVRKRDASHIPEDQHETPFLVVHVPCRDNKLLTLRAGISVEVVGHNQEQDLSRDITIVLILTRRGRTAQSKEDEPGNANLVEHLEVKDSEHARVELSSHEKVVDRVTRHSVCRATEDGREVCDERTEKAGEDSDRHEGAEFVKEGVDLKYTTEMARGHDDDGKVKASIGGAVVLELFASLVRKRLTLTPDTGHEQIASSLEDVVNPVDLPCSQGRECAGVNKFPHA